MFHHFSEDPTIERFVPHVPATNPTHAPAVWAIDTQHAPLYWFPRDCPRVAVWPTTDEQRPGFAEAFTTSAPRVHAMEAHWLARMRDVRLFRYDLPDHLFTPWEQATGQWVATEPVVPLTVTPAGDLLDLHAESGIELRIVPSLWPIHDLVLPGPWEFSIVRISFARPRA